MGPDVSDPLPAMNRMRILLVDDNEDARELLSDLLASNGNEVLTAGDGPEALSCVDSFEPMVAVLDIGLPVMDGYELAVRLRARFPALRIIALSGYGQASDRERSKAAGFDHHLVKPVDLRKLFELVSPPP